MVVVLVGPIRSNCMWILTFKFVPYCFLDFCFSPVEALAWASILCFSAEWKAELKDCSSISKEASRLCVEEI